MGGLFGSGPAGDDAEFSGSWFHTSPNIGNWTPSFKKDVESKSTMLISGGLYLQHYFTKSLAVEVGALYRPEALYYEQDVTFNNPDYYPWLRKFWMEGRFSYIEFPLLGKVVFDVKGDLLPYVVAGPSISVLISQSLVGKVGGFDPGGGGSLFRTEADMRTTLLGACIGAGTYVRTREKVMFGLDIRYKWTLQSAVKSVKIENERSRDIDLRFSSWGICGLMEVAL